MTTKEFESIALMVLTEAAGVRNKKGPEYASGQDLLGNFKRTAARAGITTRQAWAAHMIKHQDAIDTWVKDIGVAPSETLEGRFVDCINYLLLGFAILVDERVPKENIVK